MIYRWQTCLLPLQDRERPGGKSVFTQLHNCHCITEEKGFCVTTTTQRFHFIDEHVYVVYRISRGVNNNLGVFECQNITMWKKLVRKVHTIWITAKSLKATHLGSKIFSGDEKNTRLCHLEATKSFSFMVSLLVNLKERFSLNIGIGVSTSALIRILKSYLLTHLCLALLVISRTLR